jgi:DNA-binding transcriptional LysR family regulator
MMLTSYGKAFEPYAKLIVAEADNAVREIAALQGLEKGLVRVGAVTSALASILPGAIDRLLTQWPGLQVRITEGLAEELAIWLAKGDIDLAIAFSMPQTEEITLVSESGWQEGCTVVAAIDHPLRKKALLQQSDLLGEKWVMPPRKLGPREEWQQWFLESELAAPAVAVETRSVDAMRALVARSGFLCWMPRLLIQSPSVSDSLIAPLPVEGAKFFRHFAIYRRRHGVLPAPSVKLLEELRQAVNDLRAADA